MRSNRKKATIKLSEESMIELMQETYNDIVDERNRAMRAYTKYTKDIDENADIALVGKIANDLLKIVDNSIEKKLRLLKIQGDIIFKTKTGSDSAGSGPIRLTDEDRQAVQDYIKDNKKTYDE